jgi:hypothetical protein
MRTNRHRNDCDLLFTPARLKLSELVDCSDTFGSILFMFSQRLAPIRLTRAILALALRASSAVRRRSRRLQSAPSPASQGKEKCEASVWNPSPACGETSAGLPMFAAELPGG